MDHAVDVAVEAEEQADSVLFLTSPSTSVPAGYFSTNNSTDCAWSA